MKLCKKLIPCIIVLAVLLCSFTSCIKSDSAKGTIRSFLAAVKAENFEEAATFLHPDIASASDVEEYFEKAEKSFGIDFQSNMEILRYNGFESNYNNGVASYKTTAVLKVSEKEVYVTVEIIDDKAGYGIHYFNINLNVNLGEDTETVNA